MSAGQSMAKVGRPKVAGLYREPNGRASRIKPPVKSWEEEIIADALGPYAWPCVYVMDNGASIKVGFSKDIENRHRQLQNGNDLLLKMYWAVHLKYRNAVQVEGIFHRLCKGTKHHLKGEWYSLKSASAVRIIQSIIVHMDFKSAPHLLYGKDRGI